MTVWIVVIAIAAALFLLKKLFGQPSSKPQADAARVAPLHPKVDYGPRLAELRAKIKLKADAAKDGASSIPPPSAPPATRSDRFTQTVHKGDAFEIPISIKSPSMDEPLHVGSFTVKTSLVFERDEVLADLKRQATAAKDVKDWPTAIALARQAKEREGDACRDTRLAMFLQQGGLFDEAMAEFDWLLSMVPEQCDALEVSMTPNRRRFCIAHANALIHNKIRIAAKREKRSDLVIKHQELHSQYEDEADKLRTALDREWKKKRRAYEVKEAQLTKKRQSMAKG